MIIINFSHPIMKTDALANVTGVALDQIEIFDHMLHLDLNVALQPQIEEALTHAICQTIVDSRHALNVRDINTIRLPGFADAAVLLVEAFRSSGYVPNIIRFARSDRVASTFDAVELIRLAV